jgi:hypothetical protein
MRKIPKLMKLRKPIANSLEWKGALLKKIGAHTLRKCIILSSSSQWGRKQRKKNRTKRDLSGVEKYSRNEFRKAMKNSRNYG